MELGFIFNYSIHDSSTIARFGGLCSLFNNYMTYRYFIRYSAVYCDDLVPEYTYYSFDTREEAEAVLRTKFDEYDDVDLIVTEVIDETLPF